MSGFTCVGYFPSHVAIFFVGHNSNFPYPVTLVDESILIGAKHRIEYALCMGE